MGLASARRIYAMGLVRYRMDAAKWAWSRTTHTIRACMCISSAVRSCTRTIAMGDFRVKCGHKAICLCKEHHTS